ncbi:MAG TPA: FAD-dependent oxidoreductase [Solirubrobacteraceae bacterium]|jgi:2-polyprenyl-6-methoxyphenol hydroxylase-like FAD-dependent oxidoreductase|nr:FAD-dependent oxidoreductase [Solirubrobacteraceae bacterium]
MAERVLVVGGGIGGLSTTIAMTARGLAVDVVELNPKWDVYGVGILQPGNAIRALDQLGLAEQAIAAGFAMDGDRFHLADGTLLADNEHPRLLGPEYPGLNGITRPRLHEILTGAVKRSGADVKLGVTVDTLEQAGDGVTVTLTDGTRATYDLVVGADGINSLIRARVFPEAPAPEYTGQVVWRYNLPRPSEIDKLWMFVGTDGKAGLVPLSADLMYLLLVEKPPADVSLRPPAAELAGILRERLAEFGGMIARQRELITDPQNVVYRPVETVFVDPPWHRNRVVLIGDAAHATSPHVGQGAAMAMEDAIVLAEEVTEDVDIQPALKRFMERRYDRVRTVVDVSLQIGRWEIDKVHDADFLGLMEKAVTTTAAPI